MNTSTIKKEIDDLVDTVLIPGTYQEYLEAIVKVVERECKAAYKQAQEDWVAW